MTALMEFTSHIRGKNARVAIYPDRVEWDQQGKLTATRVLTGAALVVGRKGGGTEMLPMKAITSVTTRKDGLRHHVVQLIAPGNTVEMRVSKDEAEQIKRTIQGLIL